MAEARIFVSDSRRFPYVMVPTALREYLGRKVQIDPDHQATTAGDAPPLRPPRVHKITSDFIGVYFGLGCHLNRKTGKCFPSIRLLTKELSMTSRIVIRNLKALISIGAISMRRERTKAGFIVQHYDFLDVPCCPSATGLLPVVQGPVAQPDKLPLPVEHLSYEPSESEPTERRTSPSLDGGGSEKTQSRPEKIPARLTEAHGLFWKAYVKSTGKEPESRAVLESWAGDNWQAYMAGEFGEVLRMFGGTGGAAR